MSPRPAPSSLALVVCGALVRDVEEISRNRGWSGRVYGVPARHHLHPEGIAEAVDELLSELEGEFERIVVVYGDCGTGGALDRVLARHRTARPAGPHCYALLGGPELERSLTEAPETYVLTDHLVQNWETTVLEGVAAPARTAFCERFFAGFRRILWLRQRPTPELLRKAAEIADELGLPLEVHDTGLRHLEDQLDALINDRPTSATMETRP